MDVKKNLFKIILAVAFLAGFVFAVINLVNAQAVTAAEDFVANDALAAFPAAIWTNLGIALAFLGLTAATILNILDKKQMAAYVLTAFGGLALICFIVSIVNGADYIEYLKNNVEQARLLPVAYAEKAAHFQYFNAITTQVINVVVFALTPLTLGVKKVLKCKGD